MSKYSAPTDVRRIAGAALLLVISTDMLSGQTAARVTSRPDTCRYGSWSEPRALEPAVPLLAATRFPSAAVASTAGTHVSPRVALGYAVGVAGFLAIEFPDATPDPETQWPPQLRAFRLDGKPVGSPSGTFWFAYPRSVVDNEGALHVVWGEPDDKLPTHPRTLNGRLPVLRSLFHATLQQGKWGPARRIFRGSGLEWDEVAGSRLMVDRRNQLHLVFVGGDAVGTGVLYLNSNGAPWNHWRLTHVVPSEPTYLDLAIDGDRGAAIAYVGTSETSPARANVVLLSRSLDGGSSWGRPIVVSTPAEDPAIEPHVFGDRDATWRIEWVQQRPGEFTGGNVWYTELSPSGRRSTKALVLPSSIIVSHSQATMDVCGAIHVMTQAYPHGMSELYYARVTSNGWSTWSQPFTRQGAHASLVADAGFIHVVWDISSGSTEGARRSELAHATLPILDVDHNRGEAHALPNRER